MKFKNLLVVYNKKHTNEYDKILTRVIEILNYFDINYELVKDCDLQLSVFNSKDLIITVGGDGTFIKSAHFIKDSFIIGINSEPKTSEGAWSSLKGNEVEKLKNLLSGNFQVKKAKRINVCRNGILLDSYALNEVYVGSKNQFYVSRYIIFYKKKKEYQKSSGVLISTSFGSNSWYKSAGGKPFSNENQLRFIVREPFFGRIFQPEILKGSLKDKESLVLESEMQEEGIIAIDSMNAYEFNKKDKVEICLSGNELNILYKKDD